MTAFVEKNWQRKLGIYTSGLVNEPSVEKKKTTNTTSFSPDQNYCEFGGPEIPKYKGIAFGIHFFEGGPREG